MKSILFERLIDYCFLHVSFADIDECVGVNCGHGQCNDEINGYDCSCETGYEGDHCETSKH